MRTHRWFLSFVLTLEALAACREAPAPPRRAEVLPRRFIVGYVGRLDSLDVALRALADLTPASDPSAVQQAFRRARAQYKRLECLLVFDNAIWAEALNGPPIPLADEDDPGNVISPRGFQVIEAAIFPRPTGRSPDLVRRQVQEMRRVVRFARRDSTDRAWSWGVPFFAARMELARVVTLGLAGFDATVSGDGIAESADALRGVREGLGVYRDAMRTRDPAGWGALQGALDAAVGALDTASAFESFDRFAFIVRFANPVASALGRLQRSLALGEPPPPPDPMDPNPWSAGATNIYGAGAINPRWFAPDYAPPPTPELVALGRRLFFEPALSAGGRRSCATCHQPALGFTDGRTLAAVDPGHGRVRNTPTLLNAGLQRRQFADQRSPFLEFQFEAVMANPREMALLPDSAARRLAADSALVARFAAVLGRPAREALTGQTLSLAVAAYVRSLEALDSRFDRAVRGDTAVIDASERRGFNLFMGKAACGTCHFAPLFGGTMPPEYLASEPEVIGVPARRMTKGATVDGDLGAFEATRSSLHRHAFKTPTVRNVALTAPYMHNGVFRTLEQVVDFYDRGGGRGLGMRLPNQTLSAGRLRLSRQEKDDLVAFLRALTDSASTVQLKAGP